jgi:ankyrin repeat protein
MQANPDYPPPKPGEPALHRAARIGDHSKIEALVAAGADFEETFDLALDPGGRAMLATPLMVAAGSADGASVETVRLLIQLGANAVRSLGGSNAAHFAVGGLGWNYEKGGDVDRLRVLLDAGCDVHEVDPRGVTLLAEAAATGDPDRVALLLERGADASFPREGQYGFMLPLFAAAASGSAPRRATAHGPVPCRERAGHARAARRGSESRGTRRLRVAAPHRGRHGR